MIYSKDLEVFRSKSMVKGRSVFKVLYFWRYLEFSVFAKNFINFCLFLAQHFFPASEILQKLTLLVESEDLNQALLYHPKGSPSERTGFITSLEVCQKQNC